MRPAADLERSDTTQAPRPSRRLTARGRTQLPFVDGSFDAAMALHTVHHWNDPTAGLSELRRVARRVVVVAGDAHLIDQLWLTAEYFPGIAFGARREVQPQAIAERLGGRTEIRPLRVPMDCADGFTEAFIARSVAYLDPEVRRNMSTFRLLPEDQAAAGVANLRRDPASGVWDARYGHLRRLPHLDTGLRIVVSDPGAMLRRRALGQDDGAIGARTAPPTCHQRRTRPTLDRVAGERGCLGGRRC